jgi:hypothetical protein
VSFVAITTCVASQWLYGVVDVKCCRRISNAWFEGKMQLHQLSFKIRKTALDMHEILKTAFRNNAMARIKKLFSHFLGSKMAKLWLLDCEQSDCSSTRYTDKNVEKGL